jgi:predicted tellurium resistance membrane protein TerC
MIENIFTLLMLVLLQAVLGFDNLLYISMESKRVAKDRQSYVRRLGVGLAIGLRIVFLFVLVKAIEYFQEPFLSFHSLPMGADFNVHSVIVLFGGAFIVYTAVKEIFHMLAGNIEHEGSDDSQRSVRGAVTMIVIMNLVFSFDSILSAIALTDVLWVMAAAIVISGVMMIYLADHVSAFLQRNRMYEVLGLFILFIVGIMLLSEGGHLAHLSFFNYHVEPMTKTTFYFVLGVLVLVDVVQGQYAKKLLAAQAHREDLAAKELAEQEAAAAAAESAPAAG